MTESLNPDLERALEDARRIIDAEAEAYAGLGRVAEKIAEYSSAAPGIARALLDEHARAERLAEELSESTDKARAWDKVSEKNARITALEAQVATLREALLLAEDMHQIGILNMTAREVARVHDARRTALNTVDGDRT